MGVRGGLLLLCAIAAFSQTVSDNSVVDQARARLESLRALVDAGAVPRAQLAQAQENLADAQDAAFLRQTLYGQDLTEAVADDMMAAANRRLERRNRAFDQTKKLVDAGVATQSSLDPLLEEVHRARQECDLAADRAQTVRELTIIVESERPVDERLADAQQNSYQLGERHDGDGIFNMSTFVSIEAAFEKRFGKPLPVSAMGETAVHRALGFDHRGRVDVALHPDDPEGIWLREYLDLKRIPYFAFRQAVPGKATGAHIHLGPGSSPLAHGG